MPVFHLQTYPILSLTVTTKLRNSSSAEKAVMGIAKKVYRFFLKRSTKQWLSTVLEAISSHKIMC